MFLSCFLLEALNGGIFSLPPTDTTKMIIKFKRNKQREFLREVLEKINSPSLKELANRLNINYSTLKNYFSERRNLPKNLFEDLIEISGIKKESLNFEIMEDNFGQIKGGKKSKR